MTQARALAILKTGANVFLSGEPGAGKTHVVGEYLSYLRERNVVAAITASTGIAATHIGGMTIHSWSGIGIRRRLSAYDLDRIASLEHIARRMRRAEVLVIDEISMLSADTLSMVDAVCREVRDRALPFGGLQTVFVGDFFQLPPVETEIGGQPRFASESAAWVAAKPVACYLSEQHRHDDLDFMAALSAIRQSSFGAVERERVLSRMTVADAAPDGVPKLFSHNADVDRVNDAMLAAIPKESKSFTMVSSGSPPLVAALKKGCLSPETLILKKGAEVMCTKNNQKEGFVNGTLGRVVGFEKGSGEPLVTTRRGRTITVSPMDWSVEENGKVRAHIAQIPLRLAWAITVHKSQGVSLDAAVMDLSKVFEYGQGYVALSRVRRLEGVHLLGWNEKAFRVHPAVVEKDKEFRAASAAADAAFAAMGDKELSRMHEDFVRAAGGKTSKPPKDTLAETLTFWNEGKTIAEIATSRELTEGTVISHIEKLAARGSIERAACSRALSPRLAANLETILASFRTAGSDKLAPVFQKLDGAYTYDELRLVRLLFNSDTPS